MSVGCSAPPSRRKATKHGIAPSKIGAADIGSELAPTREPHNDYLSEYAEHDLTNDHSDEETRSAAALVTKDEAINRKADKAGEDEHKGVHNALRQGRGNHIAVGDVRDLVGEHRLHVVRRHTVQQPRTDTDQRVVTLHARGKGVQVIGLVDTHVGHTDTGSPGLIPHRVNEPPLSAVGGLVDDAPRMEVLAIHLDSARETSAPPKPKTAATIRIVVVWRGMP